MQEIWTRDDMKLLKTFTEQAHKSILLPSQSVLPNLIQFYFYHCFWALLYVTKADYIYIDHPPPLLQRPFMRKMKSTAGNRIWPLVTVMMMKTIGNLNSHLENQPPIPTIFFSSIFTQPSNRGSQQHSIANFCFVLSWCTMEAAAVMHKTDQKNGGPGWCKVFSLEPDLFNFFFEVFSIILYWCIKSILFLQLIDKVSFCFQGSFSKLFRRECNTGHG